MPGDNNRSNNHKIEAGKPFFGEMIVKQPTVFKSELKKDGDSFEEKINKLVEKGRKRGRRYSYIGIIGSALIFFTVLTVSYFFLKEINIFSEKAAESAKKTLEINKRAKEKLIIPSHWKFCANDLDCVETKKGCCSCAMGGEQTAINVSYLGEWEKLLKEKCGDVYCDALYKCFLGRTVCENGKCIFLNPE